VRRLLPLLLALAALAPPARAQNGGITVEPAAALDNRPQLRVGALLRDDALRSALQSGLPLRLSARVELWRDELLDELRDQASFTIVVRYEPLERRYIVYSSRDPERAVSYDSYEDARAAIEGVYTLDLQPRRGRYYYLASVRVETLSLSDLEEVENWLRGELQPAVGGDRSVLSALGTGVKRLFIRVLGLPAREVEARSRPFTVR